MMDLRGFNGVSLREQRCIGAQKLSIVCGFFRSSPSHSPCSEQPSRPRVLSSGTPAGSKYRSPVPFHCARENSDKRLPLHSIVGYFLVLMFLPETKELSLEELDQVFSIPTRKHAAWGLRQPAYWFRRYIMRQDVEKEVLFEVDPNMQRTYVPKSGECSAIFLQHFTYSKLT